jgi:hypothetical protein
MKTHALVLCLALAPQVLVYTQGTARVDTGDNRAKPVLETTIAHFEVTDAIMRDGLSELTQKNKGPLHLGFEEIIRDRIQDDPRTMNTHFSLHLENRTIRQILEALCDSDSRYTWSEDGASVDIYPRVTEKDPSYLLNLSIKRIDVSRVPDPDQALTPLSRLFPEEQVGYFGPGLGDNSYTAPWTATFEQLTVRQFINRLAEHMGPRTSWVWEGGKQERMFTFLKGGFNTSKPVP